MEKVRIGFVGAGFMGLLARLGRRIAERYRIPKIYETREELCAETSTDAVVEFTSDDIHAPVAIDGMNAGKHVCLEKPMAPNLPDARTMEDTADRNGVKLMIGYMKRSGHRIGQINNR
ncbi:MAG: Gfo/Idh/MocA family oxidoreductase [Candidatus Latescibacteria bacterium]|jgi:predicted dehydrogenase|nr:Gfo/Idh/MocA family oxidoreductase [Candidatus Latescibacterota bacterium]